MNGSAVRRLVKEGGDDDHCGGDEPEAELDVRDEERFGGVLNDLVVELAMSGALVCILT